MGQATAVRCALREHVVTVQTFFQGVRASTPHVQDCSLSDRTPLPGLRRRLVPEKRVRERVRGQTDAMASQPLCASRNYTRAPPLFQ